ncbi:MAG: ATP-grasp domain-containing protein, partial [Verrucomicrobiae bacterium]|nr:ATP-grasp domain-containing protein [Verrucomicrobiae bacterium]NNJ43876.1 ATP-grasp domain-containing protein [Akkermansiaceae bacterium]
MKADPIATLKKKISSSQRPFRVLMAMRRHVESFAQIPCCFVDAAVSVEIAYTHWTKSIRRSKYVERFHPLPDDAEEFARELLDVIQSQEFDFVFYVDEPALLAVYRSTCLSEYSRWLPFPVDSPLGQCIGDKSGFHQFMEANNLPTPKTYIVKTAAEATKRSVEMGFPLVVKETDSTSGNGVFVVEGQEEFEVILSRVDHGKPFMIQQFIEGMTVVATFLSYNGKLKGHIVVEKSIALNSGKGPSVAGRFIKNKPIQEICKVIAQKGNLSGITGLDLMIDREGTAYGIDPHFGRMTTHIHFAPYCGIHFGHLFRECLEGNLTEKLPATSEIAVVKYPECIYLIFQGGLFRLLKGFPLFSKKTAYLFKQP